MTERFGLQIGGEETSSSNDNYVSIVNPATSEVIAEVAFATEVDVDKAVMAAANAQEEWARSTQSKRANLIYKLAQAVDSHRAELAQLETKNVGKPILVSQNVDLRTAVDALEYFAGMAYKVEGITIPVPGRFLNYTVREPYGVVAGIIPWNYPLLQAVCKIAPALIAGNTVVLKPAEQAPLTPLALGRLAYEVGFPAGTVNVIPGYGQVTGKTLCAHLGVSFIAFTGSVETGILIQKYAAEHVVPVTLELGGKSPNIVFADADLDVGIPVVASGIFTNQGEVCTAGSRILVERPIYDQFIEKFVDYIQTSVKIGDPMDPSMTMGPIINHEQLNRIEGFIERAKANQTKLILGGKRRKIQNLNSDLFYEPTVFIDVDNDSELAQNEKFGPLVAIIPFESEEQAIWLANNVKYGLAAAVQTRDIGKAHRVASAIKAGNVWINTWGNIHSASPYGGYKMSGHGREMGFSIVEALTQEKSVWVSLR
jgi:acyl-CoA reductase-like NAD-dependent aldehyde dehydrogenase